MVTQIIGTSACQEHFFPQKSAPAACLGPAARKELSLRVLSRTESVSDLAQSHGVSRKFLYQQAAKASYAIDEAFEPSAKNNEVLFYLPVTKNWLRQFVVALTLICHSSFRGVIEILHALFDYHHLSLGSVDNIVSEAVQKARRINQAQELSRIQVGAHDEIFQASKPVLVGVDLKSTYCYLLACEDHRDETTWGVHLLDLANQGLDPDYTIADGGRGLRAGQAAACSTMRQKLERKMLRAKNKGKGQSFSKKLAQARKAEIVAVSLAQDVRDDLLAFAGVLDERFADIAVNEVIAETPRASSIVENLNSRLRNYFFLRRHIGNDYLHLLRFFLNHRRFQRN